jgi:hypothetical protein
LVSSVALLALQAAVEPVALGGLDDEHAANAMPHAAPTMSRVPFDQWRSMYGVKLHVCQDCFGVDSPQRTRIFNVFVQACRPRKAGGGWIKRPSLPPIPDRYYCNFFLDTPRPESRYPSAGGGGATLLGSVPAALLADP